MHKVKLLAGLIICLAFVSCATLGIQSKPWAERTPQEKALAILESYNSVYKDTMSMALMPNLTEAQKQMVRSKKAMLKEVYPLIQIYVGIIESGGIPSAADEQAILDLLNRLGGRI